VTRRAIIAVVTLCACVAGCRSGTDSARGAAESFLDEHYVRIDLAAAKQYTVGVARQKVEEEQRLVGDQQIDASTRRPTVSYRLVEERSEGSDRSDLVYDATVRFDDGNSIGLRWLVTARRIEDGAWKVSNFQEFE
jgi:hypothetical protein